MKKTSESQNKPAALYYTILLLLPIEFLVLAFCIFAILITKASVGVEVAVAAFALLGLSYAGATFGSYYCKISSYRKKLIRVCMVIHAIICILMMACCIIGCL